MKKRNRYYKFNIVPYAAELTVILSQYPDRVKDRICGGDGSMESIVNPATMNEWFVSDSPDTKDYYLIFPFKPTADSIAHECFHVVFKLLHTSGSKLNQSTEEQYAYLLGHVVGMVTDKINRSNKRRK